MKEGGKTYFRGTDGGFYDGFRSYRDGEKAHLFRVFTYEPNATIFDARLSDNFEYYYKALLGLGYIDNAMNGATLESPDRSFSYVVTLLGECTSITIKVTERNWIHIHHAGWLFDGMDNGKEFLAHYRALKAKGLRRCNTLSLAASGLYRQAVGVKAYDRLYPDVYRKKINDDETFYDYLNGGYRGGFNLLAGEGEEAIEVFDGYVYDVNSLYPFVFAYYPMPNGDFEYMKGAPPKALASMANKGERFIMARVEADYSIKPGHIPFIMPDRHGGVSCEGNRILTLTWEEMKLFSRHYNVKAKYIDYIYCGTTRGLGKNFVREHYKLKSEAKTEVDRRISKGVLNYLIGGFSRKMVRRNLIKDKKGDWQIIRTESPGSSAHYIGVAVTSYARCKIVKDAQANYDNFIYSDTDSLHLRAPANGISVGGAIGQYKIESQYKEGCYIKRKWYGFKDDDKMKIVTAGVPKRYTDMICGMFYDHPINDVVNNIGDYLTMVQ